MGGCGCGGGGGGGGGGERTDRRDCNQQNQTEIRSWTLSEEIHNTEKLFALHKPFQNTHLLLSDMVPLLPPLLLLLLPLSLQRSYLQAAPRERGTGEVQIWCCPRSVPRHGGEGMCGRVPIHL